MARKDKNAGVETMETNTETTATNTEAAVATTATATSGMGRAVILPNGVERVAYIRQLYYTGEANAEGVVTPVSRSDITKRINAMLEAAGLKTIPYQIVFAATRDKVDPRVAQSERTASRAAAKAQREEQKAQEKAAKAAAKEQAKQEALEKAKQEAANAANANASANTSEATV